MMSLRELIIRCITLVTVAAVLVAGQRAPATQQATIEADTNPSALGTSTGQELHAGGEVATSIEASGVDVVADEAREAALEGAAVQDDTKGFQESDDLGGSKRSLNLIEVPKPKLLTSSGASLMTEGSLQPTAPSQEYLWLCLEDIFPQEDLMAKGLSQGVANLVSTYFSHSSVFHGPSLLEATVVQSQLDVPEGFWGTALEGIMSGAKHQTTVASGISWAKQRMLDVKGPLKVTYPNSREVWQRSRQCYRTSKATTCSRQQLLDYSRQYLVQRPEYNLVTNNCGSFACAMLSKCSAHGDHCPVADCEKSLMTGSLAAGTKTPGCSTVSYDLSTKAITSAMKNAQISTGSTSYGNIDVGGLLSSLPIKIGGGKEGMIGGQVNGGGFGGDAG